MVAREGFRYAALLQQRHTKYGRIRGMVVGEGGRSTGVLLYPKISVLVVGPTILEDFQNCFIPSKTWTHPPISIVIYFLW